ncbi:hypothetical protein ACFE04_010028 [Oxalis oulophora]
MSQLSYFEGVSALGHLLNEPCREKHVPSKTKLSKACVCRARPFGVRVWVRSEACRGVVSGSRIAFCLELAKRPACRTRENGRVWVMEIIPSTRNPLTRDGSSSCLIFFTRENLNPTQLGPLIYGPDSSRPINDPTRPLAKSSSVAYLPTTVCVSLMANFARWKLSLACKG